MLWVGTVLLWHAWYSILSSLSWSQPPRTPLLRYVSSSKTMCEMFFVMCLQSHPAFDIHSGLIWSSEPLFSTKGSNMNAWHTTLNAKVSIQIKQLCGWKCIKQRGCKTCTQEEGCRCRSCTTCSSVTNDGRGNLWGFWRFDPATASLLVDTVTPGGSRTHHF